MSRELRFGWFERLFVVSCLLASLWVNWHLAGQLRAATRVASQNHLEPGTKAPTLNVLTLDGESQTISFATSKLETVIYFLSPSCPWCARNEANVDALATERSSFIGVAALKQADAIREYVAKKRPAFPIYLLPPETQRAYLFQSLPTTMVVDRAGTIVRLWPGAYTGPKHAELEDYFQVKLPGLLELKRDQLDPDAPSSSTRK